MKKNPAFYHPTTQHNTIMKVEEIVFAYNLKTFERKMIGVQHKPSTDTKPSRFLICETNFCLEAFKPFVTLSKSGTELSEALRKHLGENWIIIANRNTVFQALDNYLKP